ncbi:MAG: FlgD immunoglobulin-like domain containing protein, partial [Candidatus Krumholzibacteriaceae bacterium]
SAGIVADRYCVDLNDELFTRGYEIDYYFTARDVAGQARSLPKWAGTQGPYFEWTCLPTKSSSVLFVDDSRYSSFSSGTREYWDRAWDALQPGDDPPDRYDVNSPTSGVSNGPGSRAKNKQLTDQYYAIVWDSGDNYWVTIADGTVNSDKSNDCQMLIDWMDLSYHRCGLWICGDRIAQDLNGYASTQARTFMNTKCGVTLANFSYYDLTGGRTGGGVTSPLITGDTDAGVFVRGGTPDKFYAYGGCPTINQFSALGKTANGKWALDYPLYNGTKYYAGISSAWQNGGGADVRTMWFGFGFQYIRDTADGVHPVRVELAQHVFSWMQFPSNPCCCCTGAETPRAYRLAQNFPNPFNPSTTIQYDMKEKGLVRIKIYNVAGELVRTLVCEMKNAGSYSVAWDGKSNLGTGVASGIYFCRMQTKEFSATKKLVLLR